MPNGPSNAGKRLPAGSAMILGVVAGACSIPGGGSALGGVGTRFSCCLGWMVPKSLISRDVGHIESGAVPGSGWETPGFAGLWALATDRQAAANIAAPNTAKEREPTPRRRRLECRN